jgi:hypothetical protein
MEKRNRKSQKRRKNQRKRGTRRRIRGGGELRLVSYVQVYDDNKQTAVILKDRYAPSIFERGMATVMNPQVKPIAKEILQEFKKKNGYSLPDKVIFTDVDGEKEPLKMKTYNFDLKNNEWIQISGPIIVSFYDDAGAEVLNKLNKGSGTNPTVIKNSLGGVIHPQTHLKTTLDSY